MKKNPCRECIVRAMCRTGCDKLERFLYNMFEPDNQPDDTYFMAADDLRAGRTTIEYYEELHERQSM